MQCVCNKMSLIKIFTLVWETSLSWSDLYRYIEVQWPAHSELFLVNQKRFPTSSNKRECMVTQKAWVSDLLCSVRDYSVTRSQRTTDYREICIKCCVFIFQTLPLQKQPMGRLNLPHSVWACITSICGCKATAAK